MESSIPEKIVHADDCVFITEIEKTNDKIYQKAKKEWTKKILSEQWKYWIYHREERIRIEKCDGTGIKAWWLGRHAEKKRIGNYCPCKEWYNLEKELENKTGNQNQAVRDASEKCTLAQLRNLGCDKGWNEKIEQFS